MNKTKQILLLVALIYTTSCQKEFLETTPPYGVSIKEFYEIESDADQGLIACYDILSAQFDRLYGLAVDGIGNYCSEEAKGGPVAERNFSPFDNFTMIGNEPVLSVIWNECYNGIYRCNLFLEQVESIDMDEGKKNRMIAEARFLRGFYHFDLARVFGNAIVHTSTVTPGEARNQAASSFEEVMSQVIQDFEFAAAVLPNNYSFGKGVGRITQGAAEAYLGKAYLYTKQYGPAAVSLGNVVNSGTYDLHDRYLDNFSIDHENGIESVLEIQCATGTATGEGNAHFDLEGWSTDTSVNPRGYTNPNGAYMNTFGTDSSGNDDPRKDWTAEVNVISQTFYMSRKYVMKQEPKPVNQYDGELNYKLMRFADVLLLYAEALNETGRTEDALEQINRVRQRPSVNMPKLLGLSYDRTKQAIYDERKWELGCEGHRYFDLVRWGIAADVLGSKFQVGKHERMPIPITELDRNLAIKQNPGY